MGFTRYDSVGLVVILSVLALVLIVSQIPVAIGPSETSCCRSNLQLIGCALVARKAGKGWKPYSGAAFLLQVADDIRDEDLQVFLCPGEPDPDRPEVGSGEFVRMYRELRLPDGVEHRHCSYAGPNRVDFPEDRNGLGRRIIAADKCRDGKLHHEGGIVVLYGTSKVDLIETSDPAPVLEKLCYFPPR